MYSWGPDLKSKRGHLSILFYCKLLEHFEFIYDAILIQNKIMQSDVKLQTQSFGYEFFI